MTALLFPDNTVLVNFALAGRMDLLELAAGSGRGRWCGTVAKECRRSSAEPGLEDLSDAHRILGAPLYPESINERLDVRQLREELASPGDLPTDHLGEAETLAIITNRPELGGFFVTDDRAAGRLAASRKVQVVTTWDLLRTLLRFAKITKDEARSFTQTLHVARRALPPGCRTEEDVCRWLGAR